MKLNNQGWGYRMMIFLMTVLMLFLGIAIFFIVRFYNSFDFEKQDYSSASTQVRSNI